MSIIIYSNKIKTGKSTSLFNWCKQQIKLINGFIMLEENNQKKTYLANTLQPFYFINADEIISIGSYTFNQSLFTEGNKLITAYLDKNEFSIFCLDEIGKLELNQQGWHNSFKEILAHEKDNKSKLYIFIVRDYLLNEVITKYNITDYTLLDNLEKLIF